MLEGKHRDIPLWGNKYSKVKLYLFYMRICREFMYIMHVYKNLQMQNTNKLLFTDTIKSVNYRCRYITLYKNHTHRCANK